MNEHAYKNMGNSENLRVAIAQLDFLVGDVLGNAKKILESTNTARDQLSADIIVFPELTLSGYPPEDLLFRADFLLEVETSLQRLASEIHGITAVLGFPEQSHDGLYNSAAVVEEGIVSAVYRKQSLPNYGVFDEQRYFKVGHNSCVFNLKGRTIGITICEDIWHPGPLEETVKAGAELILNLNASPFQIGKDLDREAVARERVLMAGVPIIYTNLVGGQDELVFDGGSFVMDAKGMITQRLALFSEQMTTADFRLGNGLQPLPPIRSGSKITELQSIYSALVMGVRDYTRKNGFQGAVLGLSGGIDSALTLALAVDALGPESVEAVLMPSCYTADMSNEDAILEANALGCLYHIIPIEPAFNTFVDMLSESFRGLPQDTTEENLQARCRGIILMAISNKKGKILLTTGNKSEMSVGYATLYGDMAGGFAPLKDVPKMLVYQLSEYRNSITPVIPKRVIERPPSAELRPDQKDQDSLPPYPVLDAILERYIEYDQSIAEIIAAGIPEAEVRRIVKMVDRNEYKRRQSPPGVKISRRAFGRDRRYPMTSGFGKS